MKQIKFIIDTKGNISAETLEGFQGTMCHEAIDKIMLTMNGTQTEERNKDDYYKNDDLEQFLEF